jgi:HSP20 family protein
MRYRHLQYRYTMVVTTAQAQSVGEVWRHGGIGIISAQPRWRPEADVYETAEAIVVTVELAGVEEDEMEVLLFEDAVVIEGRRRIPGCEAGGVYHLVGIRQGSFRLEVPLWAPIDPAGVEAHHERGLLRIRLPKLTGGDEHGR